jgi:hypothetical protein
MPLILLSIQDIDAPVNARVDPRPGGAHDEVFCASSCYPAKNKRPAIRAAAAGKRRNFDDR